LVSVFAFTLISLIAFFILNFFISLFRKRSDHADEIWGLGFIFVTLTTLFLTELNSTNILLSMLITLYGIRLSIYIHVRNKSKREDFRYKFANSKLNIFLKVYLLQAIILYTIALPILWIMTHPIESSPFLFYFVLPIWIYGFLLESIGDYELLKFKKNPENKGKILTTGLFKFVRHPNYLGEILMWSSLWAASLSIPYAYFFIVSPLLISFLLIYVSGVKPVEDKMKDNKSFLIYINKTPMIFPPPLFNGLIYTISWVLLVQFGPISFNYLTLLIFLISYVSQITLFYYCDKKSLIISPILSIYALMIGYLQEGIFIQTSNLQYSNDTFYPPLWLIVLYPLFSLLLNSSFSFLNKNYLYSFLIGGFGGIFSYLTGEHLQQRPLLISDSYAFIFISWGISLSLIVYLNKKLISLYNFYTSKDRLNKEVTVFFDVKCPICKKEMESLKNRNQTGKINYACTISEKQLKSETTQFSFEESMKVIHGIDTEGNVIKGTKTISELYARVGLPFISVMLEAPIFSIIFKILYFFWSKLRLLIKSK
jgi:steroid 5-alpha reductase family enzyme/predicted DCC family thiol-disulfide oxidoreductase YuxK